LWILTGVRGRVQHAVAAMAGGDKKKKRAIGQGSLAKQQKWKKKGKKKNDKKATLSLAREKKRSVQQPHLEPRRRERQNHAKKGHNRKKRGIKKFTVLGETEGRQVEKGRFRQGVGTVLKKKKGSGKQKERMEIRADKGGS